MNAGFFAATAVSALVLALPDAGRAQQPGTPVLHPANEDLSAGTPVLLDAMTTELHRAFTSLGKQGDDKQLPPYFLSYAVSDASFASIRAQYGALVDSSSNRVRVADVQVRLGEPKLDNTHGTHRGSAVNSMQLPLTDDRVALERTLWMATNTGYGNALDNYLARQDGGRGPRQGRRLFARLQPGGAADLHRQARAAGDAGPGGVGAAGEGALVSFSASFPMFTRTP